MEITNELRRATAEAVAEVYNNTLPVDYIYQELLLLESRFSEVVYVIDSSNSFAVIPNDSNPTRKCIAVKTKFITLRDDDQGLVVDFGPFWLIFDFHIAGLGRSFQAPREIICVPDTPNPPKDETVETLEHCHPHVCNYCLCSGNYYGVIQRAYECAALTEMFSCIEKVLDAYNPDGPFVPLEDWEGSTACVVCGEAISDNDVGCSFDDSQFHESCGVYYAPRRQLVPPDWITNCDLCGTSMVLSPRQRNNLQSAGARTCCSTCESAVSRESAAAEAGEFICHSCGIQSANINSMVSYENYRFCSRCAQADITPDGRSRVLLRHGDNTTVFDPPNPWIEIPLTLPVECESCGNLVRPQSIVSGEWGIGSVCNLCMLDNEGFSSSFLSDIGYLEAYVQSTLSDVIPDFALGFVRILSFTEQGTELGVAANIVKTLHRYVPQIALSWRLRATGLRAAVRHFNHVIRTRAALGFGTDSVPDIITIVATNEEIEVHDSEAHLYYPAG